MDIREVVCVEFRIGLNWLDIEPIKEVLGTY
jgi:hypothetical protein